MIKKTEQEKDDYTQIIEGLNPEQAKAVLHDKGPLLILAGAGSGKTRVITHRIAHLVKNKGVSPYRILALTFTNKAAAEMKTRIEGMIGEGVDKLWVGTFHSMMVRILRVHIDKLGFEKSFIILDTGDQEKIIKDCINELNLDDKQYPVRMLRSVISNAKNELKGVDEFIKDSEKQGHIKSKVAEVYKLYQSKLKASSALDFDDILFFAVELLKTYPDVLNYYMNKFEYILVDEYQDTNHAQYIIIELLAQSHKNLCVVGDDDQSIYSFRGANINNILDFEKDFKGCEVIKLERNYRSTGNVLGAANSVISNNTTRKSKKLWTQSEAGDPITFHRAGDQLSESRYVASEIKRLVNYAKKGSYKDIAILYRINALSRNFENALMTARIPFKIFGGQRFYERKEIRDLMAYMRLILVGDDISFSRIVNVPKRGIGAVTLDKIIQTAEEEQKTCLEISADSNNVSKLSKAMPRLISFYELIDKFREKLKSDTMTLAEYFEYIQNESGMIQEIIEQRERDKKEDVRDRVETLQEHLSAVIEFENQLDLNKTKEADTSKIDDSPFADEEEKVTNLTEKLSKYLESISLYIDTEELSEGDDFVKLMTIHSAKGLEFDYVFLVGAEETIFPGMRSVSENDIEEERRLAYVSITRAKRKLYVTAAVRRMLFGQTRCNPVSRFINEIPDKYIEEISERRFDGSSNKTTMHSNTYENKKNVSTDVDCNAIKQSQKRALGNWLKIEDIKKGDKVKHEKFGNGIIIAVAPVANDAIIDIKFEGFPSKKMMLNQAFLTKV